METRTNNTQEVQTGSLELTRNGIFIHPQIPLTRE